MEWGRLLSFRRVCFSKEYPFDRYRSPFNVDFDRIIFLDAFRRLDEKTQVHPLRNNDNVHSRLSHSLEVASVGRSLGTLAGGFLENENLLPEHLTPDHTGQIVQCACLAHDIGNPPFGHSGESIIGGWFSTEGKKYYDSLTEEQINDLTHFEGNAQAFRILTRLGLYQNDGGIRPTFAVAASLMKYPWIYNNDSKKFGAFSGEKELLKQVAENTGLIGGNYVYCRHPFAYLSEAADDICYSIIDIEDAYELRMITFSDAVDIYNAIAPIKPEKLKGKTEKQILSYYRALAIGACIEAVTEEFKANHNKMLRGELDYKYNLAENSKASEPLKMAKKLGNEKIYTNPRKTMLEIGAANLLETLLENFCKAAYDTVLNREKASIHSKGLMLAMGDGAVSETDNVYSALMKVTDHISSMTDSHAVETARLMAGRI